MKALLLIDIQNDFLIGDALNVTIGDENEDITRYEVVLENVGPWLDENKASADLKLFAGLYAAKTYLWDARA